MARALQLAKRGLYTTTPNPRVGCVLVRDGQVVGEGWHKKAGEAHAEVNALHAAGDLALGATAYVTLEPCAHFGRTPPCIDALRAAGVTRVVAAMQDPNPQVSGKGLAALGAAGIDVSSGLMETEAHELNIGFASGLFGKQYLVPFGIGRTSRIRGTCESEDVSIAGSIWWPVARFRQVARSSPGCARRRARGTVRAAHRRARPTAGRVAR